MILFRFSIGLLFLIFLSSCEAPKEQIKEVADTVASSISTKEYYEWKNYELANADQFTAVAAFLKDAAIPAMKKQGVGPIGLFSPVDTAKDGNYISLLVPFSGLEQFASLQEELLEDPAFLAAGASHLNTPHPQKPFERIDSRLLVAFESMPKMEVPSIHDNPERVFELRSYESRTELKGKAKVKMFNAGGEVPIFKNLGFHPVFFATALTGSEQPNLVYMVTYENGKEETVKAKWDAFRTAPGWVAIKDLPEYKNTVSKIHSIMLKPLPGSEI